MGDGLDIIRVALAGIPDGLLEALQAGADEGPQFASGLLAYVAHAADWELGRRRGHHFLLNGPHAAIPPEEMGATYATLAMLLATFGEQSTVGNLLAATGDALDADPPTVH